MKLQKLLPLNIIYISALIIFSSSACSHPLVYMNEGVYYLDSVSGDDSAEGLSPATAWRSLDKLNYTVSAPGSVILFRAGQVFRGSLRPSSGTSAKRLTYGGFGEGERPILQNSVDLSSVSGWALSESGVWKAKATFNNDIGNIIFNGSQSAVRKWSRTELSAQGDYYYDQFWKTLRVESTQNPAELYGSIEAAITEHIVDQSNLSYASFTGLHLRYGGAHGFGGGKTTGLEILDCEFSFIGGGYLYSQDGVPVRYGNGIEFWGDASDNLVEDCYIHDIYDTGVTNQNHTTTAVQKNITYRNNIIENCALASFEFWNRPAGSSMSGVVFENNTSVNPGGGWGAQRPDLHGSHVSVFGNQSALDNIIIRNNIFYGGNLIYFLDQGTWNATEVTADYNCLFPVQDGDYDYLYVVWDDNSIDTSEKYSAGDLAELVSASGREVNSVSADPLFTVGAFPYNLSAGSPASGMGASGF